MNKKKKISIIIGIGLILIIIGLLIIGGGNKENNNNPESNNNSESNNNNEETNEQEEKLIDYDTAYITALSLYGEEEKTVEVNEEEKKFIIYVKDSNGNILNTFNMDKQTGIISEEYNESLEISSGSD